ncbi:MAG: hypothetical protein IT373_35110 [Polyangiaceae bacterium]|nr:hypothetical protein [Polyangiaceae bacterium]
MLQRIDLVSPPRERFADPTPLGLVGLAIGCAALVPVAFGWSVTPEALRTAAWFCLLFGAGCQMLAGLMSFLNHNLLGGTLFTAFAFNWTWNYVALAGIAGGFRPDAHVLLAVDATMFVVFVVFTWAFGFHAKLLFVFLLDIDVLQLAKILRDLTGVAAFGTMLAVTTVALAVIALWIAFGLVMNPTLGRPVFALGGPLYRAPAKPGFDPALRLRLFEVLYDHFRAHAFTPLAVDELRQRVASAAAGRDLLPDLAYLGELGALVLEPGAAGGAGAPAEVRLTARGIDHYEQVALGKLESPRGRIA